MTVLTATPALSTRPGAEAAEFAQSIRSLLEQYADREALRSAWDSPEGRIPGLWRRLAETGATGLLIPEDAGGAGLDLTAVLPLLVEAGRAAIAEPLTATVAVAAVLTRAGGAVAEDWLPRIADGSVTVGLAQAPGRLALGGAWAQLLIVATADGPRAVTITDSLPAVDAADRGAGLAEASAAAVSDGEPLPGLSNDVVLDIAAVCAAAELTGLAEALLVMSVDYAKTREQFGRPIGGFQAIKHQLADVYIGNAFARPVVARAAWAVTHDAPTAHRDASHAMYAAGTAARRAARTALQVHGGIGYTYEHDLHMWQKRVWTLTSVFGDPARHRARVAGLLLDDQDDQEPTP